MSGGAVAVWAPDGVPEIEPGDDLAEVVLAAFGAAAFEDGDILTVTSKVVGKAEGRLRPGTRDTALSEETTRVVARRGSTAIVRNRLGLTMAAAGIDSSNVEPGHVLPLPEDPDATARKLRSMLRERTGANLAVVISDTAGRAWRDGQTDIAIGAAGLRVIEEYAGRQDAYGNPLVVTAPAVADEIAGAAELAQGKLAARPFARLRGRSDLVLPDGEDGPGAAALIRPPERDFFGFGAREAVVRALVATADDAVVFGAPAPVDDLVDAFRALGLAAEPGLDGTLRLPVMSDPGSTARTAALLFAHGWHLHSDGRTASPDSPLTP